MIQTGFISKKRGAAFAFYPSVFCFLAQYSPTVNSSDNPHYGVLNNLDKDDVFHDLEDKLLDQLPEIDLIEGEKYFSGIQGVFNYVDKMHLKK